MPRPEEGVHLLIKTSSIYELNFGLHKPRACLNKGCDIDDNLVIVFDVVANKGCDADDNLMIVFDDSVFPWVGN